MGAIDLTKLAKVIAMTTSAHDGEALTAIRRANKIVKDAGATWAGVLDRSKELETATEAAAVLLAENKELRAEVERLQANGTATTWSPLNGGSHQRTAQWALDLNVQGRVHLSSWEEGFLKSMTTWTGKPRPKQASILERIINQAVSRTGLTPPP